MAFKRVDGRGLEELRPIEFKVGVLENADGSAEVRWGKNWIIVAVYGPHEHYPRHEALIDRGILRCRYHMNPYSTTERKSPQPSRREIELSKVVGEALEPAIMLESYPMSSIDVYIEVLQADGGTRVAGISAASLALADAGIFMKDLVAACTAGKVDGKVVLDLCDEEDKTGEADLPVAIMPNLNKVTLLQMDGMLTLEEFEKAFDLALKGAKTVYELQQKALRETYFKYGKG